jgi:hypothetical protein
MSRIHSTLIALLIGAAATIGLSAAIHTVQLGQKAVAPSVSLHELAARKAKLAAWHRSLRATLAKRPPALPKLPHFAPVAVQQAQPPAATAQQSVTYVHAPTVVQYKHAPAATTTTTTNWSDDGSDDNGSDDGGGSGGGD